MSGAAWRLVCWSVGPRLSVELVQRLGEPPNGRAVPFQALAGPRALRQLSRMRARLAALYRHPVKGFTPEALSAVDLAPEQGFPHDRTYAVENGPSGFDPANPFTPKQKFTVLAMWPKVAAARTRYEEHSATLFASAPGAPDFHGRLSEPAGREAFAGWLGVLLGPEVAGPLKVIEAPPGHRFTDNPLGQVSIINLASVRELGARLGRRLDPLRFRANVHVEGWPAWAETGWVGRSIKLGAVTVTAFRQIVRCAATDVDPRSAEADMQVTRALFDNYGHMHCGLYARVSRGGRLRVGDACQAPEADPA